jgi:oligopeptide/dipeptide ABC transporter ATP-binding protein
LFSSAAGIEKKPEIKKEESGLSISSNSSFSSCSFAPRCPQATERCLSEHPALTEVKAGHSIRCFNFQS